MEHFKYLPFPLVSYLNKAWISAAQPLAGALFKRKWYHTKQSEQQVWESRLLAGLLTERSEETHQRLERQHQATSLTPLQKPEEGVRSPGAGLTGSCEQPYVDAGHRTQAVDRKLEQEKLSTSWWDFASGRADTGRKEAARGWLISPYRLAISPSQK